MEDIQLPYPRCKYKLGLATDVDYKILLRYLLTRVVSDLSSCLCCAVRSSRLVRTEDRPLVLRCL